MCVRCGTGTIAWCESPDRHASEEQAPQADTPHTALRKIERRLGELGVDDAEIDARLTRLWEYVLRGA